ncbi:MICAL-like protein 1 isoform X1 [Lampetra fluviatilis]
MAGTQELQRWCRHQTRGYRGVSLRDMGASFRDGLAFCAILHRHRPDLVDFDSLDKDNVYENNKLAFEVAERELGIPALLDPSDMVNMAVPDRLSVLTYVSQYHNYFCGKQTALGSCEPGARVATSPSLKPIRDATEEGATTIVVGPASEGGTSSTSSSSNSSSSAGPSSSTCCLCQRHVHLVQRYLVDGKLYHRNCFRCKDCCNTLLPGTYKMGADPGTFVCTHHRTPSHLSRRPPSVRPPRPPQPPADVKSPDSGPKSDPKSDPTSETKDAEMRSSSSSDSKVDVDPSRPCPDGMADTRGPEGAELSQNHGSEWPSHTRAESPTDPESACRFNGDGRGERSGGEEGVGGKEAESTTTTPPTVNGVQAPLASEPDAQGLEEACGRSFAATAGGEKGGEAGDRSTQPAEDEAATPGGPEMTASVGEMSGGFPEAASSGEADSGTAEQNRSAAEERSEGEGAAEGHAHASVPTPAPRRNTETPSPGTRPVPKPRGHAAEQTGSTAALPVPRPRSVAAPVSPPWLSLVGAESRKRPAPPPPPPRPPGLNAGVRSPKPALPGKPASFRAARPPAATSGRNPEPSGEARLRREDKRQEASWYNPFEEDDDDDKGDEKGTVKETEKSEHSEAAAENGDAATGSEGLGSGSDLATGEVGVSSQEDGETGNLKVADHPWYRITPTGSPQTRKRVAPAAPGKRLPGCSSQPSTPPTARSLARGPPPPRPRSTEPPLTASETSLSVARCVAEPAGPSKPCSQSQPALSAPADAATAPIEAPPPVAAAAAPSAGDSPEIPQHEVKPAAADSPDGAPDGAPPTSDAPPMSDAPPTSDAPPAPSQATPPPRPATSPGLLVANGTLSAAASPAHSTGDTPPPRPATAPTRLPPQPPGTPSAQQKTICKENPFDRKPLVTSSSPSAAPAQRKSRNGPKPRRPPAPGHGFPIIKRKVQSGEPVPEEEIQSELERIARQLDRLERQGVAMETSLRQADGDEGENPMITDWFKLIHEKHLLLRQESELIYISKQQILEERQGDVEFELRRLFNKPDSEKSAEDRAREEELLQELVSIIEARNAIVESMDEEKHRDEEEDKALEGVMLKKEFLKAEMDVRSTSSSSAPGDRKKGKFKPLKLLRRSSTKTDKKSGGSGGSGGASGGSKGTAGAAK